MEVQRLLDKSLELARKVNQRERIAGVLANLAGVATTLEDYTQAEIFLRKAASLAPKDINIQRQLTQIIALALIHQPLNEKV